MWFIVWLVVGVLLGILSLIIYSEHPISVGLWFIMYSFMVAIWVGVEWSSYVGYLMFFVYVGALLVMFCMVVSLTPNPVFRVVPFVGLFPLGNSLAGGEGFNVFKSFGGEIFDGGIYNGLGTYDSVGWGVILVWLSLLLLLSMISVISMCKWSDGPLVRFNSKNF